MNIVITNTSKKPIYEQIETQLIEQILKGSLTDGEQLPSIRSLARSLGVSVITVKRAYDDLETQGYLYTIGGKGSYVVGQSQERVQEKQRQIVEEQLYHTIAEFKIMGVGKKDVLEIISLLWEEE
ncbi:MULTISPECIES: GntR family transcriptional regulator [unclassified Fusibacter]|uniref:GntR family transcriptional regulator n=1 Tax=unclassified Fusibacter TaxID=2624464 RepID=UPI0010114D98|nr:GntR family transcriptional regulator [Fusibacter sp. A1]MCK8061105.1 GntR family transcriptional regulator [Fusibacter sp. A2]NPE23359.1 GntR family transcriptional regulator [Fusibacter sp. A1]RXV59404.1 GntR family transcriptional regulator [Fusibacter sp. A1]